MKKKKEKQQEKVENKLVDIMNNDSMKLFSMLSLYFLLVLLIYTIFQFLNLNSLLSIVQILSLIIPVIVYLLVNQNKKVKTKIITISLYLFLLLILPFIYTKTYDLTVDGNSYHKTAIAFIKNGWNPLYQTSKEFQEKNNEIIPFDEDTRIDLWIEHYPKATWIVAATIYNMTGHIESGKCITLIFTIMLFIITFNCLRKILDKKWSFLISVLVAFNPIVLAQFFSYYVDGLMGAFFFIQLILLFMINPKEKVKNYYSVWLALISTCAMFVNLKFTGLLCSGVIAAVFYFYWLIKNRKEKDFLDIFKRVTIPFVIVYVIAIFIVGANSYVQNTIQHINPLYPLIGKDKVDIVTTMQPKSFGDKNMIEKFTISLFSRTENTTYEMDGPHLKLPIKLYRSEIGELFAPDIRIGGFGPFFALIFLTSVVILTTALVIFIKKEKQNLKYVVLPTLAVLITCILVGENWWARYVPQLYLLPIGALVLSLYVSKYINFKYIVIVPLGLMAIMALNTGCFAYINYRNVKTFNEINNDIKEMKKEKEFELHLAAEKLYGYYYTLKDNGVNYKEIGEIEDYRYMYNWRFMVENK